MLARLARLFHTSELRPLFRSRRIVNASVASAIASRFLPNLCRAVARFVLALAIRIGSFDFS